MVEAICVWREDGRAERTECDPSRSIASGTRPLGSKPGEFSAAASRHGSEPIEDNSREGGLHAPSHENSVCSLASSRQPGDGRSEDNFRDNKIDDNSSIDMMSLDPSVSNQTGDQQDKGCSDNVAIDKQRAGKLSQALAGGDRGSKDGSRGRGGRVAKGRWVATMMVPGRKLWDSSPAMMSQYKRHRRSRQDPKIARDQVRGTSRKSSYASYGFLSLQILKI